MRRLTRLFIVGVLVLACLAGGIGCKKQPEQDAEQTGQANAIIRGGTATEQAILTSVELNSTETAPQVKLTFSSDTVPEYTIKSLDSPYRISVETGASHSNPNLTEIDPAGGVVGVFLRDAISSEGRSNLFIQLDKAAGFTASEDGNVLTIDIAAASESDDAEERHYACINAFEEYRFDDMPPGTSELTPTLCSDGARIMLISKPYVNQSEAQSAAERIQNTFNEEKADKGRTAKVVTLKSGQRPEYIPGLYEDEIYQLKPVLIDGQQQGLPVAFLGGRYLDSSDDGKRLFVEAGFRESGSDKAITECLTILDANNKKQKLTSLTNIYSVEAAAFSPDGNGICILDGSGNAASLFYYDIQGRNLIELSSSELSGTHRFIFADDSTIYTLGDSVSKVTIDGDNFSADLVLEDASNISEICYADDKLYYSEYQPSGEDLAGVYALGDAGEAERIADGSRLRVSPDGKQLACIVGYETESGFYNSVSIVDLESGGQKELPQMEKISGFSWSPDSTSLYYTIPTPEGDYPNTLVRYELASAEDTSLFGVLTGEFYCETIDTIYIVMVQRDGNHTVPNYTVTFELRV